MSESYKVGYKHKLEQSWERYRFLYPIFQISNQIRIVQIMDVNQNKYETLTFKYTFIFEMCVQYIYIEFIFLKV